MSCEWRFPGSYARGHRKFCLVLMLEQAALDIDIGQNPAKQLGYPPSRFARQGHGRRNELVCRRYSAFEARGADAEPPGFAQRVVDHGAFFRSVGIGVGLETSPRDRDQPRRARERDGHEEGAPKG